MVYGGAGDRMAEKEAKTSLSELPEDILHHIMSLLPTTTDVIALGLSSKTLISDLHSFQLSSMDFRNPELHSGTIERFLNFMNGNITALVRNKNKLCPERFRLQAPLMLMDTDRRIKKAIGFAVRKGVKELDIDACFTYAEGSWESNRSYSNQYYPLPVQVIITYPSNSITTLNFKGLSVEDRFNELILGCPQIETVKFTSCIVPSNTRLSSNKLKNIHIAHCWLTQKSEGLTIEVDSLNLQNFVVAVRSVALTSVRFPKNCNFLKVLSLEKASISDQWVEDYVAELVNLETLILKECYEFNNFKVSNHHQLRRIELIRCSILHSIEIGVFHLHSFTAHNTSCCFRKLEFDMNACKHLKSLELCDYSLTQDFLEREISQMKSLESLILHNCFRLPITKISQPNVTRLELVNFTNDRLDDTHVHTPRIFSHMYYGSNHKLIQITFPRKCNFLKVLLLENVAISDQWVEAYVAELVNLETLTLKECYEFYSFKVSNHHKLRRIELIRCSISHSIEIGVFHLHSFTAHNISCYFRELEVDLNDCKHLKSLELCDYSLTKEFLEREISQMTSLESLILENCFSLPITKISQPTITRLKLVNLSNDTIKDIHVDTPRVVSFMYTGDIIPLHVYCSEPLLKAKLSTFSDFRDPRFKLKTWFEFISQCKTATLVCESYMDFTLPRNFRNFFTSPLNGLKRLKLEIGYCSWSRSSRHLVQSLLWLYPDLEALSIEYTSIKKGDRRYVINVPCHDPRLLAEFLEKNTDYCPCHCPNANYALLANGFPLSPSYLYRNSHSNEVFNE